MYLFKLLPSLLIFFLNWYDNIRKKHQYRRSFSLMKKILYLFVSGGIILIGGCGFMEKNVADMDPKDLPDVSAFQDDFTREFMTSTEPVEDGYYEFESKTGGYTMNFPENALMSKGYYERKKDTFERFSFGEEINQENSNIPYYVIATYDNFHKEKDSSRLLNLLSRAVNFEGEYEEFTHENNTIFFATSSLPHGMKKQPGMNFLEQLYRIRVINRWNIFIVLNAKNQMETVLMI